MPKMLPSANTVQAFQAAFEQFAHDFETRLEELLAVGNDVSPVLVEAVRYAALGPGKRIRPYLVVRSCVLAGGRRDDAWPVAAAVECVHTFSLVHDDLPAMDNDDLRRGRPTCHRKFGEAVAILAGDALIVLAFELLARHVPDPAKAAMLVVELARGAGWAGMVGGQTADILGQSSPPTLELTTFIHERKTAALFESACRIGAIAGGAPSELVASLGRFGQCFGKAFQIADDLLDETSTVEKMGKVVSKDQKACKQTTLRCVGLEQSRTMANQWVDAAVQELHLLGPNVDDLRWLARHVVDRDS